MVDTDRKFPVYKTDIGIKTYFDTAGKPYEVEKARALNE